MKDNLEIQSTELSSRSHGFRNSIKNWWVSLPPWGRTLISGLGIGGLVFLTHDAFEHDYIPSIRVGSVELSMTSKQPKSVEG